jgi:hypothetical protein
VYGARRGGGWDWTGGWGYDGWVVKLDVVYLRDCWSEAWEPVVFVCADTLFDSTHYLQPFVVSRYSDSLVQRVGCFIVVVRDRVAP